MHPVESSTISKSATSKTAAGKAALLSGKQNKMDVIFPLMDQYITNAKIPSSVFLIFKIYVTIQAIIVPIWPMSEFMWREGLADDRYFSFIKIALFFIDYSNYWIYIDYLSYVILALTAIIVLFLSFQLWYYINKRSFLKWSLYGTKVITDIIVPTMIMCTSNFLGAAYGEIYNEYTGTALFHLLVGILAYFIEIVIFSISSSFTSHSVIISSCMFPSFDSEPFYQLILANSVTTILSFVVSPFPKWMGLIVPIVHIIWQGITFVNVTTLPFHTISDNVSILGLYVTGFVCDLATIIFFFAGYSFKWVPVIIAASAYLLTVLISYFIIKKVRKTIKRELNFDEFGSDDEATDYFISLKLDASETKALKYLYASVGQCCADVINVTYFKFLCKFYTSNKVTISTLQMLTFFPSETRSLNALFRLVSSRRDLNFAQRFVIYQIYRVKSLRASSSSESTNQLIIELKDLNGQVEANIRHFWTLNDVNYRFAEELSKEISAAEIQWKEAREAYPNNEKISQEYSRFLTESKCDFDEAIYQHQITEMIENGHNFAVDNSFRSFVRTFPNYLIKEYLDIRGKKIQNTRKAKNTDSSLKSHSSGSASQGLSSTSFTIDAEMEEAIGKRIINNSRMRLALHHAIEDKKSSLNKWMHVSGVIMIGVCFGLYIFMFIYMDKQFELRSYSNVIVDDITTVRFNGFAMFNTLILYYANLVGRIGDEKAVVGDVEEIDKNFKEYYYLNTDFERMVMFYTGKVKWALSELFKELADLSIQGVDVYTLSGSILNESALVALCEDNSLSREELITVKNKIIYTLYQATIITGSGKVDKMFENNNFCEAYINYYSLPRDYLGLFKLFDNKQIEEGENLVQVLNILIIVLPVLIAVFSFFPILIITIIFVHRFNRILKIFEALDQDIKDDAKNPISIDSETSAQAANISGKKGISKTCLAITLIAVLTILQALLMFFFVYYLKKSNDEIVDLCQWFTQSSDRICAIQELFCDALMIPLLNDTTVTYASVAENVQYVELDKTTMINSNDCLLKGCEGVKTSFGYADEVDHIHFQERCDIGKGVGTLHDVYGCSSVNQQISIYLNLVQEIAAEPILTEGGLFGEKTLHMFHLVSHHLVDATENVIVLYKERIKNMHPNVYKTSILYLAFGITIAVVEFITFEFFINFMTNTYKIILILIKHMSPTQLLASKELMNFVLNRKSKEDDKSMGTAQSIIHNTIDAIICTSNNGIVEIANPAVTNLLGYTPDQILGQHIDNFLSEASRDIVTKQMALMQNGQSAATYDDHIACISDSAIEINFYVTIIGMKSEGSNNISSFVFILSDETELLKQQKEAEEAKAKSEKLLYQILPKDIVVRLNRGEKDITFTVPSATIIFVDIVKFSEYAASLTPQDIMGNLSVVFAGFDGLITKYPVLTKIKLIGDVYMAAAGLFLTDDTDPQIHAEATVRFAIDCINELEDINMKLNASLEVRVGVNTGGPLIAGVLGTDKPTFDIIGDPINISARLQSTDIPGKVQISKATYEIVSQLGFNIEERGEVFLKGKGRQMTYIVHPHVAFMGQSGSILSTNVTTSSSKL